MSNLQNAITDLQLKHSQLVDAVRGASGTRTVAGETNEVMGQGTAAENRIKASTTNLRNRIENDGQSLILDWEYDVAVVNGEGRPISEVVEFSRSTGGGRFGPDGKYEWVEAGVPRIDYDPETGECRGLLVEEQRTNHLSHSGDLTAAAWSRSPLVQVTRSPHRVWGHVNRVNILEAGSTISRIFYGASASGGFTGQACLNIVAKATDYQGALWFGNRFDGSSGIARIVINLIDGSISSPVATSSYGSRPLGDGWWHFWFVHENTADLDKGCVIRCQDSTFVGDLCDIAHVWVEEGSFPTSYIPTEGAAVTRAADNSTRHLGAEYNDRGLTLFVEGVSYEPDTDRAGSYSRVAPLATVGTNYNQHYGISRDDRTASVERVYSYLRDGGTDGGVTAMGLIGGDLSYETGVTTKAALSISPHAVTLASGGVIAAGATLTNFNLKALTQLNIGREPYYGNRLNGHISQIRIYPFAMTEAQLQELTQ